ncbi:UBA/TS-N domain protein (macronuclear) [Tetrahymena thermophila SB210]|uniref:UBA/TS-N domain protein n=1 Tax=Tetrahymena thermophila (strain SB210) TaxID=312017 RepID=Q247Z3_TETTS|nr:UBA/TS-N domain protein [Tetrahymena thermophila SB210]EAS04152.2 UBA/TS-N domain protein [Tetrahymena thermophila SB210]|eukprot:XP_001024397.2 UBA/TS-N domain protein [Tetrahymena thermophila SB210]
MDSFQIDNKMSNSDKAQKALQKQKKNEENIQKKIDKYGFQKQVQQLVSKGFSDMKGILKALKKSKGDVDLASQILAIAINEQNPSDELIALQQSVGQDQRKNKIMRQIKGSNIPDQVKQEFINSENISKINEKINRNNRVDRENRGIKNKRFQVQKEEEEEIKQDDARKRDNQSDKSSILLSQNYDSLKNEFLIEEYNGQLDQFKLFHEEMQKRGFNDKRKNFKAFKKNSGDQNLALQQLERKKQRGQLKLVQNLEKGQFLKVYIDCDNCYYLEKCFSKFAIKGDFMVIEEKIATLMKVFQRNYENIEVILIFSDSQLLKNRRQMSLFINKSFQILSAIPQFRSTKELYNQLLDSMSQQPNEKSLFISSNRMLQSLLIEKNVKNIMESQRFFKILQDDLIGIEEYAAILCI